MIREWLARKLYPAAFKDAERYDYLLRRLDDLQTWCGHEAPEIDHALVWAKRSARVHFMPLAEYDQHVQSGDWAIISVGGIDSFRQEMRERRLKGMKAA